MSTDDIVRCLDGLAPLGDLPRTGWLLRGVVPAETIAAHSYAVAVLAGMIADELRAVGVAVNGERAIRMALMHDAPEAHTGDIPMPQKTPELAAALDAHEDTLARQNLTPALYRDFAGLGDGSIEATIVHAADKLQLLHHLGGLAARGRAVGPAFEGMWNNPKNLRGMEHAPIRALFEAMFARAGRAMPVI